MLKLTAIVSLVLIGSTMWAASLSCDSCGNECTSACGTRHFRSCCFNYLRKKRSGSIAPLPFHRDVSSQQELSRIPQTREPVFVVENIPEQWTANVIPSEYRTYPYEDMYENRVFDV